jgi:hypothetical protein
MLMTTTPNIEGKKIVRYCGVVTGEAILGANIFKDVFAGIRDIVGGRSGTYENELQRARDIAMTELGERYRRGLRVTTPGGAPVRPGTAIGAARQPARARITR